MRDGQFANGESQMNDLSTRSARASMDFFAGLVAEKIIGQTIRLVDTLRMAELLDVSPSTVERLAAKGVIPKIKLGDLTRYNPMQVIQSLEQKGA